MINRFWGPSNLEVQILPKLVVMFIILVARFLLLGDGHLKSGNNKE